MLVLGKHIEILSEHHKYSLHSVLIDIFPYGTMNKDTTSVLINLINATDFFVGPPMFQLGTPCN